MRVVASGKEEAGVRWERGLFLVINLVVLYEFLDYMPELV